LSFLCGFVFFFSLLSLSLSQDDNHMMDCEDRQRDERTPKEEEEDKKKNREIEIVSDTK
jgi:hypothetical protein